MHSSFVALSHALQAIAPLELSQAWDNTGWIIAPRPSAVLQGVLLCIDLTPAVAEEAQKRGCTCICAYHPPLFQAVKALSPTLPLHDAVMRCIQAGIAIYSPHTALDAAENGLNDWLASRCGPGTITGLPSGSTRVITLDQPTSPRLLAGRLKRALRWKYGRIVLAPAHRYGLPLRQVAVCAGAGASALKGTPADAWLTGEMSHHDLLAAREAGISVVLSEHTRTERPYLPVLARRLSRLLPIKIPSWVSRADRDWLDLA